jgi:RsiW-degrading membrane proteinase PrsW (M82 family)
VVPAILFAHLWALAQLTVLGSFTRTVSMRTLLLALAGGFYFCGPLALLLQYPMAHLFAWVSGDSAYAAAKVAGYTTDPWIEEIVKVLPIVLLLRFASVRRQWSLTDCTLVGAAAGAGFGLAEDLFRYGTAAAQAGPNGSGWILSTSVALPTVAGFDVILQSWLPMPVATTIVYLGEHGMPFINLHLAWSATVGFAAGLMFLDRRRFAVMVGIALLAFTALDHDAVNAMNAYGSWIRTALVPSFDTMRNTLGWRPVVVLIVAWWLDRQRQRAMDGPPIALAAEDKMTPRVLGTLRAAVSDLPGSLFRVLRFVRLRRAYYTARRIGDAGSEDLRVTVDTARLAVDSGGPRPTTAGRAISWTPATIASTLVVIPTLVFFLVGGWPQTAWLQASLLTGAGWGVTRATTIVALGLMIWRLRRVASSWRLAVRQPAADDLAAFAFGTGVSVGSCLLLGGGAWRILMGASGRTPLLSLAHILEAAGAADTGSAGLLGTTPHAMHFPPGIGFAPGGAAKTAPTLRAPQPASRAPQPQRGESDLSRAIDAAVAADALSPDATGVADAPDVTADELAQWADRGDTDDRTDAAFRSLDERFELDAEAQRAEEAARRAARADADYEEAHQKYLADMDVAKAADAAARAADPNADPHAAATAVQAAAEVARTTLEERASAAHALADAERAYAETHARYSAEMAAARAADDAARAANPNATPHAVRDVQTRYADMVPALEKARADAKQRVSDTDPNKP